MQSLDDDMDELFRRAADEYPLNTKGADWNKVMQDLHGPEVNAHDVNKKKNDYRFLLLLLLLPIGFVCGRYVAGNSHEMASAIEKTEQKADAGTGQKNRTTKPATGNPTVTTQPNQSGGGPLVRNEEKTKNSRLGFNKKTAGQLLLRGQDKPVARASGKKLQQVSAVDQAVSAIQSQNGEVVGNGTSGKEKETKPAGNNSANLADSKRQTDDTKSPEATLPADTTTLSTAIAGKSVDTAAKATATAAGKKNTSDKKVPFKKSFFFSLVGGPDLSAMKLERTHNLGFSLGVLFGYQVSKRLSVQTGALWDRKSYYAKGKYFDTSYLKLPMHSKVQDATGHCNMIEIPVNVKYDFVSKPHHSWFASAGFSSYIMKKEDYKIYYTRYNQMYDKDYRFKNSSKNWFSIMNISAGYNKSVGKYTSFSVAPYFKVPLRGVGIAKLPISSAGVYLSVSRSLHK